MALAPAIVNLMECPICYNTLTAPVAVCVLFGHGICQPCRRSVRECPVCRSDFSPHKSTLLDQIASVISRHGLVADAPKCGNEGCAQLLQPHQIDFHEKKHCAHRVVRCFLENCGVEISASAFHVHVEFDHPDFVQTFKFGQPRMYSLYPGNREFNRTYLLVNETQKNVYYFLEKIRFDWNTNTLLTSVQFLAQKHNRVDPDKFEYTLSIEHDEGDYDEGDTEDYSASCGTSNFGIEDDISLQSNVVSVEPSNYVFQDRYDFSVYIEINIE